MSKTEETKNEMTAKCIMRVVRHDYSFGLVVTFGVFKGAVDDVAAYWKQGDIEPWQLLAEGMKMTERNAKAAGLAWPEVFTYRK